MKKRLFLTLLFCMMILLVSCGGDTPEETSSPASESGSQAGESSSQPQEPSEESQPEEEDPEPEPVDKDALYVDILLRYGGKYEEDGKTLIPGNISLYYMDRWNSVEELTPGNYFSWYLSYLSNEELTDEEREEKYASPLGESASWFVPEEIYVSVIQQYFNVSEEYLQSDSDLYHPEHGGYGYENGGGGRGEQPPILLDRVEEEGDFLHLYITLEYEMTPEEKDRVLTVRILPEGGYHFVSYVPASQE